ncbi:hypothetical protein Hanom_Chr01g00080651 [Helianthus anomalus]
MEIGKFYMHVLSTYTFYDSRSHYPSTTPSLTLYSVELALLREIRWTHSFNQEVFKD